MKRHLGLHSGQMTTNLLSRIQQFNRYLPYSPGTGNKFDTDDIREMVYNALPTYVHTMIATSDYKWYDKNKLDAKVCAYFDCLLVISLWGKARNGNLSLPLRNKLLTLVRKIHLIKDHLNTNRLPKTRPNVSDSSSATRRVMRRTRVASS
jgi:hypothetical protein